MITVVLVFLSMIMIITSIIAISMRDLAGSVISILVVLLLSSVLYTIYGAPNVAVAQAAIGSAISAVIIIYILYKLKCYFFSHRDNSKKIA